MAKMRVAVLYDVWDDGAEAEEEPKGRGRKKPEKEDRQEIHETLKELGHSPFYVEIDGTTGVAEGARRHGVRPRLQPHRVVGRRRHEGHQHRRLPRPARQAVHGRRARAGSTSRRTSRWPRRSSPSTASARPYFASVHRGRLDWSHDLQFPVIVKPAREDGSIGISFNALCESIKDLMERIDDLARAVRLARCSSRSTSRAARCTWPCSATASPRRCPSSSSTSRACPRARRGSRAPR